MFYLLALAPLALAQTQTLRFDQIREACLNPAEYQNQVAPKNLQLSCEERSTRWAAGTNSPVELPRQKQISASLTSDKYQVAPETMPLPVDSQRTACPKFKEILDVLSFTKVTTCEEILAFRGTEFDFCADVLERVRQSNPRSIQSSETGQVVDLCQAAPPVDRCERGQRGQRDARCQR
jgi:hypothetical protein